MSFHLRFECSGRQWLKCSSPAGVRGGLQGLREAGGLQSQGGQPNNEAQAAVLLPEKHCQRRGSCGSMKQATRVLKCLLAQILMLLLCL